MWDIHLKKVQKVAAELMVPGLLVLGPLNVALEVVTNFLAWVLGSGPVRRHFRLLSGLVVFGPVLSLWVSKYSIFANSHHYLHRKFLRSTWGWTCTLTGSFILLLSVPVPPDLGGVRRIAVVVQPAPPDPAGGRVWGLLRSRGAGPGAPPPRGPDQSVVPEADMTWRGYEVSQDVLVLCLCCLLIVEETSVFCRHLDQQEHLHRSPGAPFLLCAALLFIWMFLLLCMLAYFPAWPS